MLKSPKGRTIMTKLEKLINKVGPSTGTSDMSVGSYQLTWYTGPSTYGLNGVMVFKLHDPRVEGGEV